MSSFRFEHNLTRPYPFKWYTPAVLVGFTIAAILFSVLNYASNGYTLQAAYLSDPRPTTWPGMDSWYKNWPASLVGGNKPSCQPASIPIGSTIFTNNTALPWKIEDVGFLSNSTMKAMPSLVYQGEELTDCELIMITISVNVAVDPGERTRSIGMWQIELEGKVYCRVYKPSLASIQLNLTSTWSFNKYQIEGNRLVDRLRPFLGRDYTYLSLLWAEALFSVGNVKLTSPLYGIKTDDDLLNVNYTGVLMQFARDYRSTTTDIKSRQFFHTSGSVRNNSHHSGV
jgi:hypothetical protein